MTSTHAHISEPGDTLVVEPQRFAIVPEWVLDLEVSDAAGDEQDRGDRCARKGEHPIALSRWQRSDRPACAQAACQGR